MKQLTIENFKAMLDNALKNIKEREDEFSKLDAVIGDGDHGQAIVTAMSAIVATAQKGALDRSALDSLTGATTELLVLTKMFLATESPKAGDESGEVWYNEYYEKQYEKVVTAVRDYMTSTQSSLAPRAEQLKKNAYRAVTPVLISLVVMIATVLMLFYFTMLYCVNPIVAMNKGLGQYLTFRIPFAVKAECKDEILELKEKIEALVAMLKQNKA